MIFSAMIVCFVVVILLALLYTKKQEEKARMLYEDGRRYPSSSSGLRNARYEYNSKREQEMGRPSMDNRLNLLETRQQVHTSTGFKDFLHTNMLEEGRFKIGEERAFMLLAECLIPNIQANI